MAIYEKVQGEMKMKNRVANLCEITAVIMFIVAFIGGIIVSNQEIPSVSLSGRITTETVFNWTMAFSIWLAGFISGLLLIALGEIITLLQDIKNNTEKSLIQVNIPQESTNKRDQLDESIPKI